LTPFQPTDPSVIEKTRKKQGKNFISSLLPGTQLTLGYHCVPQDPKISVPAADTVA